jgi:hypothetical protein
MNSDGRTSERRNNEHKRVRFEDACAELKSRLAHVCADMSPDDFAELAANMARIQVKYEGLWRWPPRAD